MRRWHKGIVGSVVLGLLTSLGGVVPSVRGAESSVRVIFVQGTVEVQRPGTSEWLPVQVGATLAAQETIRTGAQSLVELAFDERQRNVSRLEEAGQITIEQLVPMRVHLPRGKLFSLIKQLPAGSRFEVRTPTAVVGVRGTSWLVTTDGQTTRALVFSGSIFGQGITPLGELTAAVAIDEGFKALFDEVGEMGALEQLTEEGFAYWKQVETEMMKHIKSFQSIMEKILPGSGRLIEDISQGWKKLEDKGAEFLELDHKDKGKGTDR